MKISELIERVEDVAVAVIPEADKGEWYVYLLNLKNEPLEGVIVSSKGYGSIEGKDIKTSTLRQFIDKIPPQHFVQLEWIDQKLFGITNEFWVSFYQQGKVFDKQYVFVTDSIVEDNFTDIPLLDKRGVMIK